MPADEVVFVGVGLLLDAVIKDEHAIFAFDLTKHGFDHAPQVGTGLGGEARKRVAWSCETSPSTKRDRPVAVVGPNELMR